MLFKVLILPLHFAVILFVCNYSQFLHVTNTTAQAIFILSLYHQNILMKQWNKVQYGYKIKQ